jgi:hypothetical protein
MKNPSAHPAVRATMQANHGLITRQQALHAGLQPDDVLRALRRGLWIPVRRGQYVDRELWESLDELWGRPRLTARAVHASLVTSHVLSHDSAALFLGLPTLRQPQPLVHVTKQGSPRAWRRGLVKHHQSPFPGRQVVHVEDLPVLDLARTAVDIAREHGHPAGVVAVDAARQLGVSMADLWAAVELMWRWPYVTNAREAIELSDPGAESVGETLARLLIMELGIGPIQTQFEMMDEMGHARCDLRVGRHLFEFDGRLKYRRRDRGGVANRDPEQVVWDEKVRQDWACGHRLGMSRIVWADFWGDRRRLALRRLAGEYAATCALFGTSIDDLADIVVHRRSPDVARPGSNRPSY